MKSLRLTVTALFLWMLPFSIEAASADDAVRTILKDQETSWNRGDLKEFVKSYADRCSIVGSKKIFSVTRAEVLRHYQEKFPSRGAMGHLVFSEITVQQLGGETSVVTGRFQLDRDTASGGDTGGVFSLVLQKDEKGWHILLDHTS